MALACVYDPVCRAATPCHGVGGARFPGWDRGPNVKRGDRTSQNSSSFSSSYSWCHVSCDFRKLFTRGGWYEVVICVTVVVFEGGAEPSPDQGGGGRHGVAFFFHSFSSLDFEILSCQALHGSVDFVLVRMAAARLLHGVVQLLPLCLLLAFRETPGSIASGLSSSSLASS